MRIKGVLSYKHNKGKHNSYVAGLNVYVFGYYVRFCLVPQEALIL